MIEANLQPAQPPEQDDTWDRLLKQTELFAAGQAAVRWWRHAHDGVMPDGYDPNSIAAQAVTDLLQNRKVSKDENLTEAQICQVQNELERLVCLIVDRLWHRKENSLLSEAQAHQARYPQPPKAPDAKMGPVLGSAALNFVSFVTFC